MEFQETFELVRWRGRYERIRVVDHEKPARTRPCWMKKLKGRIRGVKLSRHRKLNWKPFSFTFVFSRKIGRKICGDFVKRLMNMDEAYPGIIFSCQWGLPILSH